jgi:hypothetical protein
VASISVIEFGDRLIKLLQSDADTGMMNAKDYLAERCDFAVRLLQARVAGLNKAFIALKLECVG